MPRLRFFFFGHLLPKQTCHPTKMTMASSSTTTYSRTCHPTKTYWIHTEAFFFWPTGGFFQSVQGILCLNLPPIHFLCSTQGHFWPKLKLLNTIQGIVSTAQAKVSSVHIKAVSPELKLYLGFFCGNRSSSTWTEDKIVPHANSALTSIFFFWRLTKHLPRNSALSFTLLSLLPFSLALLHTAFFSSDSFFLSVVTQCPLDFNAVWLSRTSPDVWLTVECNSNYQYVHGSSHTHTHTSVHINKDSLPTVRKREIKKEIQGKWSLKLNCSIRLR